MPRHLEQHLDRLEVSACEFEIRMDHHLTAALVRVRELDPEVDDVVLVGPRGRLTETSVASLLVRIGGAWCTPPLEDGCLPGIGRRLALALGEAIERSITVQELSTATQIAVVSSVRGWRPAVFSPRGAMH